MLFPEIPEHFLSVRVRVKVEYFGIQIHFFLYLAGQLSLSSKPSINHLVAQLGVTYTQSGSVMDIYIQMQAFLYTLDLTTIPSTTVITVVSSILTVCVL